MPEIVRRYNTSMGGVDILDKLLSSYRPRLRSKKWWWNLFSNALNLAVVAAWRLHRELHQESSIALSHLDFTRDITTHLLRAKSQLTIRTGRRAYPPETLRITQGHYLEPISQGRCRVCKKNCRNQMRKYLEIPCMDTVANCMSHNRFETLLRFLHFSDNDKVVMDRSHPDYDRFYKIRSLIESICKTCLEETPGELRSVDEHIILYKGRCKMKYYNPRKPDKWGLKVIAVCGRNRFVHDFWLCDGMAPKVENPVDFFAAVVVMKVCETLPKHKGYTAEVAQSQATHGICKSTLASRQVELARRTKGCEWFSTCATRNDCNKPAQLQQIASLTPLEVWSKVFADEMIYHITFQSNLYAHRECKNRAFTVSPQEIRQFIGVILLSGYNCQPEAKHDWSTQPDIGAQGAISCMSHNRFMKIKKYLHLADNQTLVKGDKMSKVTPLYKLLNSSLVKHGMFHEKLSVDESIVPYFGRHATKMILKGKPIRFGYKLWMLCGNDGYPHHMIIYQGKEMHASKVPLSIRVISNRVDIIQENSNTTRHTLYFDNFFNSYDLLVNLSGLKMRAIGTIRPYHSNGADAVMLPDKELMKQKRVPSSRIASNFLTNRPLRNTQRRVKGQRIEVQMPNIVRSYNTGVGGVDYLDRLAAAYRPTIRSKKCYWPLFINAVNIVTVVAWRIHCFVEERPLSHLKFRRQVVLSLLQSERTATPRVVSDFMSQLPDIRFDGVNHILGTGPQGRCKKCNVRLHAERGKQCFESYHRQK
ncbi:putative piggyBac transposable element-derived protein 2 [Trichinella spiralis]|nr:putative piggyBac transposable element-derived protein 2 [Trichinella spiralis]